MIIVSDGNNLEIKLWLNVVISYLPTHKTSDQELLECERFQLTAGIPWEPYLSSFENEDSRTIMNFRSIDE